MCGQGTSLSVMMYGVRARVFGCFRLRSPLVTFLDDLPQRCEDSGAGWLPMIPRELQKMVYISHVHDVDVYTQLPPSDCHRLCGCQSHLRTQASTWKNPEPASRYTHDKMTDRVRGKYLLGMRFYMKGLTKCSQEQ